MHLRRIVTALALAIATPAYSQSDPVTVALRYVKAQEAVMAADAGKPEVDALLGFYSEDYTYYHPQVSAKMSMKTDGADTFRRGITSHLGETSDARIEVRGVQISGDHISVTTITTFTMVSNGQKITRSALMILGVRDGKIAQRADIWPLN